MVKFEISPSNYQPLDSFDETHSYSVRVRYRAMNYFELINAFQLGLPINALFFTVIGALTFLAILLFWVVNIGIAKSVKRRASIKFCHYMKILIIPPLWGTIIASIPPTIIAFVISATFSKILPTYSADWTDTAEPDEEQMLKNIRGRIGICFLFTAVVFLVSGALLLIHRPDEKEEEELRYHRVLQIREQRMQDEAD